MESNVFFVSEIQILPTDLHFIFRNQNFHFLDEIGQKAGGWIGFFTEGS